MKQKRKKTKKTYADESFELEARIELSRHVIARLILLKIGIGFVHQQVEVQLHHSSENRHHYRHLAAI